MPKVAIRLPEKPEGYVEPPHPSDGRIIKDVCFFGDSSITEDSDLYKQVWDTARLLAQNDYTIINGGGPGVMKAATDGAESVNGRTIAIYWQPRLASIFEGRNLSNVTDESEAYSNYMMRTLGLIEKSHVYVVCKGGTGTMSELGMVWALAKLYYGKHKPVILYGDFWKPIIDAIQHGMLIDDNELAVLHYATTKEEVLELIQSFEQEVEMRQHRTYEGDETSFVLAPRYDTTELKRAGAAQSRKKYKVQNAVTQRQLEEFREMVAPPARVLEVGCGAGGDTNFLAEHYSVTAIDKEMDMVNMARFENPNADILHADIRDYEVQDNVFKGIWTRDALHHLNDEELDAVIPKLAKGLVPGGILSLVVREGEGEALEPDMHGGRQVERFYHYFTESELIDRATNAGLELVKIDHVTRSHNWLAAVFRKPE